MITVFVAPESAPQIVAPKPPPPSVPPRLQRLDELLLANLHESGTCFVWSLLNAVADEQDQRDRTAGRLLRLELLNRLRHLRKLGLAFSVSRNQIAATKPDPATRRPTIRRRRRTVARTTSVRAVSATAAPESSEAGRRGLQAQFQMDKRNPAPSSPTVEVEKIESAPAPELVSAAGRQLATLPRRAKRWSGWIGDRRGFHDMPILLPNGRQAFLYGALRNKVVFTFDKGQLLGTLTPAQRWGVLPADQVQVIRNEAARLLGSRKRGTHERPSALKAAAARVNGTHPCHPGKSRGRPRVAKLTVPTAPRATSMTRNPPAPC